MSEEEDPQQLSEIKSVEKKKKKKSKKKSKKSKKDKKEVETTDSPTDVQDETMNKSKPQEKTDDNESDDDSDLEGLASMWAETKEYEEKKKLADSNFEKLKDEFKKQKTPKSKPQIKQQSKHAKAPSMQTPYNPNGLFTKTKEEQNAKYSLHITNLPYHVQKHDIEEAFKNKGCEIISTRLVYNYHVSRRTYKDERRGDKQVTNENGFTGVAFIDVRDEKSYKLALSMDKTVLGEDDNEEKGKGRGWRRRKMNVRPTKTQKELADIVKNTKQKVQEQKEEYEKLKSEEVKNDSDKQETPKKKRSRDEDGEEKNSSMKKKRKSKKDGDKKLTKKERARKAAILRQKK